MSKRIKAAIMSFVTSSYNQVNSMFHQIKSEMIKRNELHDYHTWMENSRVNLLDFPQENGESIENGFIPYRETLHLKDGSYMTLRCGFGALYTCVNDIKDDKWLIEYLDGSTTIAYRPLRETETFEYFKKHNLTEK